MTFDEITKKYKTSPEIDNAIIQMMDVCMKIYELGARDGVDLYTRILRGEVTND